MSIENINGQIEAIKQLQDEHRAILSGELLPKHMVSDIYNFRPNDCPLCSMWDAECGYCVWVEIEEARCTGGIENFFSGFTSCYSTDLILSCLARYERWLVRLDELAKEQS